MFDIIVYFIAFIITVPIIATWIVYQISVKIYQRKLAAIHTAANWTTILYIFSVSVLLSIIFNDWLIGWIIVLLLFILVAFIFIQWKTETEINFKRAFKGFWRLSFLLFTFLYICLIFIGLVQQYFFL